MTHREPASPRLALFASSPSSRIRTAPRSPEKRLSAISRMAPRSSHPGHHLRPPGCPHSFQPDRRSRVPGSYRIPDLRTGRPGRPTGEIKPSKRISRSIAWISGQGSSPKRALKASEEVLTVEPGSKSTSPHRTDPALKIPPDHHVPEAQSHQPRDRPRRSKRGRHHDPPPWDQ